MARRCRCSITSASSTPPWTRRSARWRPRRWTRFETRWTLESCPARWAEAEAEVSAADRWIDGSACPPRVRNASGRRLCGVVSARRWTWRARGECPRGTCSGCWRRSAIPSRTRSFSTRRRARKGRRPTPPIVPRGAARRPASVSCSRSARARERCCSARTPARGSRGTRCWPGTLVSRRCSRRRTTVSPRRATRPDEARGFLPRCAATAPISRCSSGRATPSRTPTWRVRFSV